MKKITACVVSFLAGIVFVIACDTSVSKSVADSVVAALSVTYDNAKSALKSTNVQDAIDEIVADGKSVSYVKALTAADLDGTWNFTKPFDDTKTGYGSITFNSAAGTYSASPTSGSNILVLCASGGRVIVAGDKVLLEDFCTVQVSVLSIIESNDVTYFIRDDDGHVLIGTKQ